METSVAVGNRVSTTNGPGTVRFVGPTSFATGKWVGIELDGPQGKHNGRVQGKAYFSCRDGYGIFVRPVAVKLLDEATRRGSSIDESSRGVNKVVSSTGD
jgi:dynactin 1